MMTRRGLAGAAALLLTAVMIAGAAPAGATHSWANYHWGRTANPFTLQLGDNVSGDWVGYLGKVSTDWSVSTVLDTNIVSGTTDGRKCRASAGRVEVCNAKYGFNGWLGLARIWISGSHIVQGTAQVNDSYFGLSTYNNELAKLHVLCQEVGHTFGLGHTDDDSCMNDLGALDNPKPIAHDFEQLDIIYAHLDSVDTYTSDEPPSGDDGGGGKGGGNGKGGNSRGGAHRTSYNTQHLGGDDYLVTITIHAD